MQYMEVGDDNLSFAIWTGSDPNAEIFTMTVSSPEKKKDWLLALQKLQESQISFAMGKLRMPIYLAIKKTYGFRPQTLALDSHYTLSHKREF